jgi:hypothetical protein
LSLLTPGGCVGAERPPARGGVARRPARVTPRGSVRPRDEYDSGTHLWFDVRAWFPAPLTAVAVVQPVCVGGGGGGSLSCRWGMSCVCVCVYVCVCTRMPLPCTRLADPDHSHPVAQRVTFLFFRWRCLCTDLPPAPSPHPDFLAFPASASPPPTHAPCLPCPPCLPCVPSTGTRVLAQAAHVTAGLPCIHGLHG